MNPGSTAAEVLRRAAHTLEAGDVRESLRATQQAQDVLDGVKAELLVQLRTQNLFELDGASTAKSWVRQELRMSSGDASKLTRCGDTLYRLPAVADAVQAGQIRLEHVNVFAYGLKHIGDDVVTDSMDWLLGVAKTSEPGELFAVMKQLRDAVYPDELDEAWAKGADKAHFSVEPVPLGYHVSGFLPAEIGAKLRLVLDSLAAPKGEDDQRSKDQRNVDAGDELASSFLESGLPSDKGIRPHLSVRVDAETLGGQPGEPATLDGFGPVGPQLLGLLACTADVTPVLTQQGFPKKSSIILNVGRSQRLATLKQRRAVLARQEGRCAAPGCRKHAPGDPSRHLVVQRWAHGLGQPDRVVRTMSPPRAPRTAQHLRGRRRNLHLHHPHRSPHPRPSTSASTAASRGRLTLQVLRSNHGVPRHR